MPTGASLDQPPVPREVMGIGGGQNGRRAYRDLTPPVIPSRGGSIFPGRLLTRFRKRRYFCGRAYVDTQLPKE
jgi:hypothetical protein